MGLRSAVLGKLGKEAIDESSKAFGMGDIMNVGITGVMTASEIKEGKNPVGAIAKGVGELVLGEFLGNYYFPVMGIQMATQLALANSENATRQMRETYLRRGSLGSGTFNMTQAGYTMRQRSLNAIASNSNNVRSTLGGEARAYFHSFGS